MQREAVRSRCETIHTLTLCEMNHFHEQRRNDFRDMVQGYLDSQMKFHLEVRRSQPVLRRDAVNLPVLRRGAVNLPVLRRDAVNLHVLAAWCGEPTRAVVNLPASAR